MINKIIKKIIANGKLIGSVASVFVTSICVILAISIFMNYSLGWFSNYTAVEASGMSIVSRGKSYDLITLSNDNTNKNGVYYNPYHSAIRENESEAYDIWLVDSDSNIENYSGTGVDDGSLGIEPGSSGVIKYYIRPYDDVTINFTFQTIGYIDETPDGSSTTVMTELDPASHTSCNYLNGHILLFEDYNTTTHYYSGFIPADGDGKREFTRFFDFGGSYDTDTDGDSVNDAYEVDIYWIWPETLDNLVHNENNLLATVLCDKDEVVQEGETSDYNKIINNICAYPDYYLCGHSTLVTYTETLLRGKNVLYNDADQEIGMNINYVLLRLGAEPASD